MKNTVNLMAGTLGFMENTSSTGAGNIFPDLLLTGISFFYGFMIIGAGMLLQKRLGKGGDFTRKIIHLFAGYASYVVFWFSPANAWLGIVIGVSFTLLLVLSRPGGILEPVFASMAREEDRAGKGLGGPVLYAISLTVLTSIFVFPWTGTTEPPLLPYFWIPASTLGMMFLGDGAAPFIGKKWGRHPLGTMGRTMEGTLAVFLFGYVGGIIAYLVATFFSPSQSVPLSPVVAMLVLAFVAACNAAVEAISPGGYDNVTCPAVSTATLVLLLVLLGVFP